MLTIEITIGYILDILGVLGLCAWTLILFFLKKKNPKSTYDVVKILTTATIIFNLFAGWIQNLFIYLVNPGPEMMKLMVILAFYSANQMGNIIVSFNIYSFIFEYRTPKIDPNLPHWITCILGVLIPFCITYTTHSLDKLFASSSFGPNIVEHVTGLQGERLVFIKLKYFIQKRNTFYNHIYSVLTLGFFYILLRLVSFISISVHVYLTLSRQEDLESRFALCKVFGLSIIPIIFLCIFIAYIALLKGEVVTFLPIVRLLFAIVRVLFSIGIIVTNDELRLYSGQKILLLFNVVFHCMKSFYFCIKKLFCCQVNQNQIHVIEE